MITLLGFGSAEISVLVDQAFHESIRRFDVVLVGLMAFLSIEDILGEARL